MFTLWKINPAQKPARSSFPSRDNWRGRLHSLSSLRSCVRKPGYYRDSRGVRLNNLNLEKRESTIKAPLRDCFHRYSRLPSTLWLDEVVVSPATTELKSLMSFEAHCLIWNTKCHHTSLRPTYETHNQLAPSGCWGTGAAWFSTGRGGWSLGWNKGPLFLVIVSIVPLF